MQVEEAQCAIVRACQCVCVFVITTRFTVWWSVSNWRSGIWGIDGSTCNVDVFAEWASAWLLNTSMKTGQKIRTAHPKRDTYKILIPPLSTAEREAERKADLITGRPEWEQSKNEQIKKTWRSVWNICRPLYIMLLTRIIACSTLELKKGSKK